MTTLTVKDAFKKLKDEVVKLAAAIGQDVKNTNSTIGATNSLNTENKASLVQAINEVYALANRPHATQADINNAIRSLKNELMGGELDAQLDTLKEIGDKLKELQADDNLSQAIVQKFTEVNEKIIALEQFAEPLQNLSQDLSNADFLQTYNQARGN